jgi:hypothetical protein
MHPWVSQTKCSPNQSFRPKIWKIPENNKVYYTHKKFDSKKACGSRKQTFIQKANIFQNAALILKHNLLSLKTFD